jgi:hypothetical protein
MAALSFKVFGVSVAALKLPLLVVNLVIAFLLLRTLVREAALDPRARRLSRRCFFIAAPPGDRCNAGGGERRQHRAVSIHASDLADARARPGWCGAIFAVGFMQREFTLYSLLSLALIAGVTGRNLFTREALRRAFAGLRAAAECVARGHARQAVLIGGGTGYVDSPDCPRSGQQRPRAVHPHLLRPGHRRRWRPGGCSAST